MNVFGGSLLVSIKSFFRYVLTFELNGLTTFCSIRTFTRMAGVHAQLVLKNPIKGEPLQFYAGKRKARLIAQKGQRLRVSARHPFSRTSTLAKSKG